MSKPQTQTSRSWIGVADSAHSSDQVTAAFARCMKCKALCFTDMACTVDASVRFTRGSSEALPSDRSHPLSCNHITALLGEDESASCDRV